MLHAAVVHVGISPDEFWQLTWYEYDLYLQRMDYRLQKEKYDFESDWSRTRSLWTILANVHRKPNTPALKPSDLIKLSFDTSDEKPEDVDISMFPKTLKNGI